MIGELLTQGEWRHVLVRIESAGDWPMCGSWTPYPGCEKKPDVVEVTQWRNGDEVGFDGMEFSWPQRPSPRLGRSA